MNDFQVETIINTLHFKHNISDLEKEILDTYHELHKIPFDMNSARKQIRTNDLIHPDMTAAVAAMPNTVQKKESEITTIDVQYVLSQQLNFLIAKRQSTLFNEGN